MSAVQFGAVRHLQFQDHYRDNNRNDAITERGQTIFSHRHGPAQPSPCRRLYPDILVIQAALNLRRRIKESSNELMSISQPLALHKPDFSPKSAPPLGDAKKLR